MMDQQVFDTEKGRTTNLSTLNIALIVIIVILGLATVALGFGYFSQQNEIRSLTEENIDLWSQNWDLEKADLHRLDDIWYDLYPDPYININGIIFNSGTDTAYDVVLTVDIYDYQDVLINSHDYQMANILGKDYEIFDFNVYCSRTPDHVLTSTTWEYFP